MRAPFGVLAPVRCRKGSAMALLAATLVLGVEAVTGAPADASPSSPGGSVTLRSAVSNQAGSWVVLPMGRLSDPDNTFWQLLYAPPGSLRWSVVTPPGVADNGGLVAAVSGDSLVVAVLPSGLLRFSPLSTSSNGGASWSSAFVPGAVAGRPDALAVDAGSDPRSFAVVSNRVATTSNFTSWTSVASLATLRRAAPGCAPRRIDAVTTSAAGQPVIGLTCARGGKVGLISDVGGRWSPMGPPLPEGLGAVSTSVVRLEIGASGTTALVSERGKSGTGLVVAWQDPNGSWVQSSSLGDRNRLLATSVSEDGMVAVLTGPPSDPAVSEVAPGGRWTPEGKPPAGTAALAFASPAAAGTPGQLEAFTVTGTKLTVYAAAPVSAGWTKVSSSVVPLAYGSSS